ncbi:peptidoglycan recognition family protein [Streptomyces sp. NPDC048242]|uniref:peptidoglycan recognition protein family protein n=1 Tax=Streptomyces sp. NPDC048242 TaxID=3155026 RepID=UPI00343C7E27
MATPLTADQILKALRAEGLTVHEVKSWRTHNRAGHGAWGPLNGVMLHHTAGNSGMVDYCYNGSADLPGPLCHGVIDKKGEVWLVGSGRANHAGGGDPKVLEAVIAEDYGDKPPAPHQHQGSAGAVDGNARFYGFECINLGDGKDPWPDAQVQAMVRAGAALCRAHKWGAKSVIGHKEWSDWKSDPAGASVAMPTLRGYIKAALAAKPGVWTLKPKAPAPTPTAPKPTPTLTTEQRIAALEKTVTDQGKRIAALEKKGS